MLAKWSEGLELSGVSLFAYLSFSALHCSLSKFVSTSPSFSACHLACLKPAVSAASPILSLLSEVIAHEEFLMSKKDLIIHCNHNLLKFF